MCREDREFRLQATPVETGPDMVQRMHIIEYKLTEPVGQPMELPKPNNTFRLFSKNPNGISVGDGGSLPIILEDLQTAQVDMYLAPEIKLDTTQEKVLNKAHRTIRAAYGRKQKSMFTSSTISFPTQHKPGGVMTLLNGDNTGRVYETGSNAFGQWTYMKLNGGAGRQLTVIATYQVCQGNVKTSGPTTAITQQYSMHEQDHRHNPHRLRWHHSRDITNFVKQCQAEGELIVLAGDFNETLGHDATGMTKLCNDCGLVDPVFELHGCSNFNTHINGTSCIDYILIDPALMPAVQAAGYEAFGTHIVSDHRGVYIDVNESLFFGNATLPPPTSNPRVYNSKSPKHTVQYFEHMTTHLEDHNWFNQLRELRLCMSMNTRNDELADRLDNRRLQACKYTENKLQKFPREPYSPALRDMRRVRQYLKAVIQCLAYGLEDWDGVVDDHRAKLQVLGITCPQDLASCRLFLREHERALRATEARERKDAPTRRQFQEMAIQSYTDDGNKEAVQALRRIQRAEATSAVFQQCAHARGLTKEGGLSYVEVPVDAEQDPKQCTEWQKLDNPEEVEEAIRARLKKHFSRAKDCNLTSPPFDVTMKFTAACNLAENILTGALDTSNLEPMTADLLECFQYAMGPEPAVEATIDAEDLTGKIKTWLERTSTSPLTGVHLGHAKAYIAYSGINPDTNPQEYDTFCKARNKIIEGHVTLLNYALQFGHSYPRWKRIVNSMLEKDPGKPRIHRLRVIHLYEWDFNLLLCVKWRKLLHHICDNNLVNQACYGTMPGHSSLDPVFVRELEYEMCRLTRRPLVHFDNDATSCYDRIPCFLANLASRKYGMDKKVCIVQGRTLQEAKYYLRTRLGISAEHAEHTRECPWFGTGQGSGNSPFYWLLISSTLYDLYCSKTGGGASYASPNGDIQTTIHLLGFVDDVNNRTNLPLAVDAVGLHTTIQQLLEQASKDSQLWHDILTAANQELELSKCKYHVVHFQFAPDGTPSIVDTAQPPAPLRITGKHGQAVAITHVPNSKAIKYLGCHKAPMNQTQQMQVLQQKCLDYARVMNSSRLSRRGSQVFYQAIYRLSVGYPLPVCYFTKAQLDTIQAKAHTAMLQHMGYSSRMSKLAVFGPTHLGGAEFFHLYDEQGYGQVSTFLKFWRSPHTHAGTLLRITVAWAQYSVGTSTSIFTDTIAPLPHLESSWLASMREYLRDVRSHLELDASGVPPRQRLGDSHIMDQALLHPKLQPNHIRKINYCRLYLRVVTIADIATADGIHIAEGFYHGWDSAINHNSKWHHVHQQKPGPKAWACWRRLCNWLCTSATSRRLSNALGSWVVPQGEIPQNWKFWLHRSTDTLYHQREDGTYTSHSRLYRDFDQDPTSANIALHPGAVPVDTKTHVGTWSVREHIRQVAPPPVRQPVQQATMEEYIQSLDQWERSLLEGLDLLVSQHQLFNTMQQETVWICSDGAQVEQTASFGWVLSDVQGNRLVQCMGPCLGADPTSYRAEGHGLLSICRFLRGLWDHFGIRFQRCHIWCDNKSILQRIKQRPDNLSSIFPNETLASEWDILIEIWHSLQGYNEHCEPAFSHVKGHQDKNKPYQSLPLQAQLNVDADALATDFLQNNPDMDYSKALLMPHAGGLLHTARGTLTYKMKRALRMERTAPPLLAKLCKRYGWSQETARDINWEASRLALGRLRQHRVTLIKHLNNVAPLGWLVHLYDPKHPSSCPGCDHPEETREHLYQCDGPRRLEWREQFRSDLGEAMDKQTTAADLKVLMLEGIQSVLEARDPDTIQVPDTEAAAAVFAAQSAIGWPELLKGRLSKAWAHNQQEFLGAFDPKKNGHTWAITMAETLLRGWHNLWTIRNQERHGRDAQSRAAALRAQAIRELELLYTMKGSVAPRLDWILATPLEQRKNLKTYHMRAFINCFGPILQESYKERLATG